ncbi:MAG: hypothetical protein ACT4OJ_01190 [Bacteroidota bacterium]
MIDKIYKDVSDRLTDKVATMRWIELEYGQLEIPEENYPVQFPCSLIDISFPECQDETHGNQQVVVQITVRTAIDPYEDLMVIDGAGVPDQQAALEKLGLFVDVYKALHGFETDYMTPLVRTSLMPERRDDGLKVVAQTFMAAAKDDSAARIVTEYTGATLEVEKV